MPWVWVNWKSAPGVPRLSLKSGYATARESKHYLSIGYRYTLTQIYVGNKYLRCTLWRTQPWNCTGKAFIYDDNNLLTNKQDHNHAHAVYNSETIKLRNKLKRAAENSTLNLREMFDDQTRDEEAGA